ncbi:MAG TPA: hypothetical protein VJU82_14790 [Acidobacteriaceae bacterium]|nr:hypothetical protein [Acidobacteriaceae bacterium]
MRSKTTQQGRSLKSGFIGVICTTLAFPCQAYLAKHREKCVVFQAAKGRDYTQHPFKVQSPEAKVLGERFAMLRKRTTREAMVQNRQAGPSGFNEMYLPGVARRLLNVDPETAQLIVDCG